jgi:PAS domain S-box-containing protein
VIGDDFVIRTVNSAFEAIFGLSKDGIVGTSFLERFPFTSPDDSERFIRIISRCLEGKVRGIPEYHINIAGQARSMNVVLSPLRIDGVINGVILSASDVSEAVTLKEQIHQYAHELEGIVKERTKELRSEKEKLNALVNSIEAGICIFEDDGSLAWANRVFGDWLPEGGVSGIRMDDIFAGKHTFEELKSEITSKKIFQEIVYRDFGRKAGYFQTTSTPLVSTEDRKQILLLIQDVTEVRKAEEQMMQSEKLSALARLSAGVAHEIGNPLTSISSYVQILKEMDFDDFTREALSTISRQINRIAMIVRQMSSFTKTKTGMAGQSVREIVDSTLQLVKYDRRMKKVEISEDVPDDAGSVKVNGDQLEQVFINIVLNAADAMQSGGSLNVSASRSDGFVDISFRDTGLGITPGHIERIFDPFFTTKETGTGLGLAVSYTIVRSLGGTIQVSSVPGEGTTFTVRLPIYEG